MTIETADEAAEAFKSFDDWQYADREAAWEWMFEQGRIAEREACRLRCANTVVLLDGHHGYTALKVQQMMIDAISKP